MITLTDIDRCLQRVLPGVIATCDREGVPNVNYVTQIQVVDDKHIALSYQFPTKTRLNLEENPRATLEVYDPLTLDAYRLELRFDRVETSGALFDQLAYRIEAIASYTGLAKIFRLRAAYVCEVTAIEKREGFLQPSSAPPIEEGEPMTEMRGLQLVSNRISRARTLDELMTGALAALDEAFGFSHGAILVPEEETNRLVAVAQHGYAPASIGAYVNIGDGLIGVVAKTQTLLRVLGLDANLDYSRKVKQEWSRNITISQHKLITDEVPLPMLPDARSQMAIPLVVHDRLLGVIALEARDTITFSQWHEAFLQVLANQIASAMELITEREDDDEDEDLPSEQGTAVPRARQLTYFRNDDCIFVDGEYLIRNVPAKILWKLLRSYEADQRTEFSNRELRLDPSLGLPAFKDNLESRLILLRKRLEQKVPELRLVPTKRGKFALEVGCPIELVERETA